METLDGPPQSSPRATAQVLPLASGHPLLGAGVVFIIGEGVVVMAVGGWW